MKKILVVCSMVILSLFCVGCTKTIELTEEENKLIAEYAAELLLKYDRNYDYKFYESHADVEVTTEGVSTEEITTESDVSGEDTTETTTESNVSDEDTTETTTESDIQNQEDEDVYVSGDDVVSGKDFDLASFVGVENVSIKYNYYMLAKSYPSYDQEGMYIEIEAPEGYQLLVVKFNIENQTGDSQEIDLFNKDIQYNIIINNSKAAKQMLTILMDDLYTYQASISGDGLEEAALLFQVSDSVAESIEELKLRIKYGDSEATISLD
ncbi:MAG: hypothetical protein E7258_07040 [Lachnospiraceae bacterium]|nr:hypothetical protein [Lachnospiraceae bacterium]